MKRTLLSFSGVAILIVGLMFINGISKVVFAPYFIDLTQEKLYTLSSGTNRIVENLEQPITLRYYFSKTDSANYSAVKLYGARVLDLLRQYERAADGKIVLEMYDPRPDSEEEEWAQKYGLAPIPTQSGERLYLGLVAVGALGDEEVISMFNLQRQEFIEYDITKLIYSLSTAKKPVVGVLSSLNLKGKMAPGGYPGNIQYEEQPWIILNQLEHLAEVRVLETTITAIPEEVDALAVIHPKEFSNQLLFAIDQFVLKGGNLIAAVDPYCFSDQPKTATNNPAEAANASRSSDLNVLFKSWGVSLVSNKVAGDIALSTKVNSPGSNSIEDFVMWLSLRPVSLPERKDSSVKILNTVNQDDVVTSALENVVLPWAGSFEVNPIEGVESEVLLATSLQSKLFDESDFKFSGSDPTRFSKNFVPSGKPQILALRLNGKLKSAFPEGAPASSDAESAQMSSLESSLKESKNPANIILIADVDFLADQFSVRAQNVFGAQILTRLNDNINLAQNAVENLTGSDDLISLRSRGKFSREFTKVQEIERNASSRWLQEEQLLQARLNAANQRLTQLQNTGGEVGQGQLFSKALVDEIKKFKDDRDEAQKRLREVRRNLRQDKERLGEVLFVVNTFVVPLLIIVLSVAIFLRKRKAR